MRAARRTTACLLLALLTTSLVGAVSARAVADACAAVVRRGSWEHVRIPSFPAGPQTMSEYGVDPFDPERLYATNGVSVVVSGDGGCSWKTTFRLDQPPAGAGYSAANSTIVDLTVAPGHALLAVAERDRLRPHVVLSSYSGETWRSGDDGLQTVFGRPLAVAMTRANPGYAYLLVEEGAGAGESGVALRNTVFESTTAGGAWAVRGDAGLVDPAIELPVLGSQPGRTVLTGMVADPIEAGRLFLFGPDGLYEHQQGRRTQLLDGDVRAAAALRGPTAIAPTLLVGLAGSRTVQVSVNGGISFTEVPVPGEVDSFAEALRPEEHYVSAGGRVYLRTAAGRLTPVPGGEGVVSLSSARSERQVSPFRARSLLTLYGRTSSAIVRTVESRSVDLLPVPDSVVVGNLDAFAADPHTKLPGSLTPEHQEVVLREGRTRTIPYELTIPETPTPLDVFFDVDTTNSMVPALDGLRDAMADIIVELTAEHIDVWFGVGEYKSFGAPPAFARHQDIAPPGQDLADALNQLVAGDGGDETQLESLRQIALGVGSDVGVGIPAGEDAHWRKGSLRIVVDMTDEPISTGGDHPTYDEVGEAMRGDGIVHFGIAVQNAATAEALGPPLPGLIEIARRTDSYAPPEGVDCDGDEDPDLYEGEPLVCVIDHASSRNAGVLGGAIISVLSSLRDVGEVEIAARVDGPAETAVPNKPVVSGVDFKANNHVSFDMAFTCPDVATTRRFPVEIEAARASGVLAAATALVTCKPEPEPAPPPLPVLPVVVPAIVVPPPPPPPVNIGPHPNPQADPQPNPNPQPQAQGQPQGAIATQRQTQPQLAFVQEREASFRPAEARRGATEEYALSAYAPPRAPGTAMLGFAAAIVIGFGGALLALQRAELRVARATRRRYRC